MADFGLHRSRQAPAEDTPSFGGIAERFRRAGDLERAIALCQEGLKKFPNQLSARVTLGWAYLDRGEYDLARAELEKVLRRAPDNLAAIRGMAELHDRAEHTAPSMSAVGHWSVAEEAPAEVPAPTPVPAPVHVAVPAPAPAAPVWTPPVEAPVAAAPVKPIPVVPAAMSPVESRVDTPLESVESIDALSLIETPAQAAVARSSHVAAAPAPSIFGRVAEAAPGQAIEPETDTVHLDAAWTSGKAGTPDLSGFDLSGWSDPPVAADNDVQSEPILLAQQAEIDLAQIAPELIAEPAKPATPSKQDQSVVLELPTVDVGLEGALLQFEQVSELDPDLPPATIPAAAVEASVFAIPQAMPAAFEVVSPAEEAMFVVEDDAASAMDAALFTEQDTADAVDDAMFVVEDAAPAIEDAVLVVEEAAPAVEEVVLVAEAGTPAIEEVEFQSAPATDDLVLVAEETAAEETAPAVDVAVLTTGEVALPDAHVLTAAEAALAAAGDEVREEETVFAAPQTEEAEEEVVAVVAIEPEVEPERAIDVASLLESSAGADRELDIEDVPPAADDEDDDDGETIDEIDDLAADEPSGAPDHGWVSPGVLNGNGNGHYSPSVSAMSSNATAGLDVTTPAHSARAHASSASPLAALEGFLRKVGARKLHLTPGSMA